MRELPHAKCPLCKRKRLYLPFTDGKNYHCGHCKERFSIFEKELIFKREYEYHVKHHKIRGMLYIESLSIDPKSEEKLYFNRDEYKRL